MRSRLATTRGRLWWVRTTSGDERSASHGPRPACTPRSVIAINRIWEAGAYCEGRRAWISRVSVSIFSVKSLVLLSQRSVRLDEPLQIRGLLSDRRLALLNVPHYFFTVRLENVQRVLVSVGLAGLRKQDQWCCVGGLCGEDEVQQDEGVGIPVKTNANGVHRDPCDYDCGLPCDVLRRTEEASRSLSPTAEVVLTECARDVRHEPGFGMA
jgi:hypothetical protein